MKMISVRDLRTKSAQIWKDLQKEQDLVVTSNGKPIGILSATTDDTLEESLEAVRRARATLALMRIQMDSLKKGKDKMTLEEINRVIAEVRKERRER
jgi:antitoxin (DNA-binding transcriptional repressor) of toxin-antitoxin stability system